MGDRNEQVLTDQIRHGFSTRQPYDPPAKRKASSWANARASGFDKHEIKAALGALARQDRIRLRALCAGLRALRQIRALRMHPMIDAGFRSAATGRAAALSRPRSTRGSG
jgi:hypothetical protein